MEWRDQSKSKDQRKIKVKAKIKLKATKVYNLWGDFNAEIFGR